MSRTNSISRSTAPPRKSVESEGEQEVVLVPTTFRVQDEASANWVVRHIAAAIAYKQRVKEWAEAEVRRAEREEAWLHRRFDAELSAWAKGVIGKQNGRRKSIALPAGVVGFRSVGPALVIDEESEVLKWARKGC